MNTRLSVDVLAPGALSAPELEAWRSFREASPRLSSPYFAPEFALAADGVVPGAAVAVIHDRGAVQAFLPFQKRGGVAQPLGAPVSDYHGLISRPGAEVDLLSVVRAVGASCFSFTGLRTDARPTGGRTFAQDCMVAGVGEGLEAYLELRPRTRKFFKEKARRARALAAEVGELEFRFEDGPGMFDVMIGQKRAQYARTGRHDIFACGWTERFLRRLWEIRTPEFGGVFTTLHAGGNLVAAEYGLRGGAVHHIWFPVYDPEFGRFGPGTTLTIEMIKAAAADPKTSSVDFGTEDESYKAMYASRVGQVYEGSLAAAPSRLVAARLADAALAAEPLAQVRDRLRRRFAIINACETTPTGWAAGAASALRQAARRAGGAAAAEA